MTPALHDERAVLGRLAFLVDYPAEDFHTRLAALGAPDATLPPAAAAEFARFAAAVRGQTVEDLQELYARTFDLAPPCVPYVGIHVLGAESNQRPKLMAGLLTVYRQPAYESGAELPDHIALVLRHAPLFSDEEWTDFRAYCLDGALKKMLAALDAAENPYRHALRAAQAALGAAPVFQGLEQEPGGFSKAWKTAATDTAGAAALPAAGGVCA